VPVHVIDTAGLRPSDDPIEMLGIARTWAAIEQADLVLLMADATRGEVGADREIMQRLPADLPRLTVMNKIDLVPRGPSMASRNDEQTRTIWLSAKSGAGLELLREALVEFMGLHGAGAEGVFMARERHLQALLLAQKHLDRAVQQTGSLELLAEELRLVQRALSSITGEFSADDLLGEIFARFCIGK
jgi:tRNA modification GTPase